MKTRIEQPKIETKRLLLEQIKESDLQDIFNYTSNSAMTEFVTWDAHKTIEDTKMFYEWIKKNESNDQASIFFVFGIRLKETGKVIGTVDFKKPTSWIGQMDYALCADHWNKGIMTEATNAVKDWAFKSFPEVVRLQSGCIPENRASSKVMEKMGMTFESIRKKCFMHKGKPIDLAYYVLIR